MPTITRQQIKRVEDTMRARIGMNPGTLRGFAGLGDIWTDIFGSGSSSGGSTPPIRRTGSNQQIEWTDFLQLLRGGQLRIEATQFAEGMNRLTYGMEPGCTDPTEGIPVVPNTSSPRFCATSVAGMIERCRTYEALNALNSIKTQFLARINNQSDPMASFIGRWWTQYGVGNDSRLRATITSAAGVCGITGDIPKLCTAPQVWSTLQMRCVYSGEDGAGTGVSTVMLIGIAGVFALMMFMRK